jgi:hypothetical protein
MRSIVVGVGKKLQNVYDLVVVVDRRNQSVMVLDVENCYFPSARYDGLISRRQHLSQVDQIHEMAANYEFLPMLKRSRSCWIKFRIDP